MPGSSRAHINTAHDRLTAHTALNHKGVKELRTPQKTQYADQGLARHRAPPGSAKPRSVKVVEFNLAAILACFEDLEFGLRLSKGRLVSLRLEAAPDAAPCVALALQKALDRLDAHREVGFQARHDRFEPPRVGFDLLQDRGFLLDRNRARAPGARGVFEAVEVIFV